MDVTTIHLECCHNAVVCSRDVSIDVDGIVRALGGSALESEIPAFLDVDRNGVRNFRSWIV